MMWLFAFVVVALLGCVAVVASGRWGGLREGYDDRRDALVPADRPLSGTDLRQVRFTTALVGYRVSEVDALLDRLARELESAHSSDAAPTQPLPGAWPGTPPDA
ncbi:MAG: DivIVA domain-containing protein [Nocardioidaceae bacterium]